MFSHYFLDYLQSEISHRIKAGYHTVFVAGNLLMLISVMAIVFSIIVSYVMPEYFSLSTQVFGHITMMVFAAGLKIGYVMRLIGENGQAGSPHIAASGI